MNEKLTMNNKRALVCGSSKGIGAATAIELSNLGASITLRSKKSKILSSDVLTELNIFYKIKTIHILLLILIIQMN